MLQISQNESKATSECSEKDYKPIFSVLSIEHSGREGLPVASSQVESGAKRYTFKEGHGMETGKDSPVDVRGRDDGPWRASPALSLKCLLLLDLNF